MDFFPLGVCFRSQDDAAMATGMKMASGEGQSQASSLLAPVKHHRAAASPATTPYPFRRTQTTIK